MSASETFDIVKSVLFSPITIFVVIAIILYIALVNYVTYYTRKEKIKVQKKPERPVRRRRKVKESIEDENKDDDDEGGYTES